MDSDLIDKLVSKTIKFLEESQSKDLEKACWMVIHEYHHGILPFEYDIREIDESIYLAVLEIIKEKIAN